MFPCYGALNSDLVYPCRSLGLNHCTALIVTDKLQHFTGRGLRSKLNSIYYSKCSIVLVLAPTVLSGSLHYISQPDFDFRHIALLSFLPNLQLCCTKILGLKPWSYLFWQVLEGQNYSDWLEYLVCFSLLGSPYYFKLWDSNTIAPTHHTNPMFTGVCLKGANHMLRTKQGTHWSGQIVRTKRELRNMNGLGLLKFVRKDLFIWWEHSVLPQLNQPNKLWNSTMLEA